MHRSLGVRALRLSALVIGHADVAAHRVASRGRSIALTRLLSALAALAVALSACSSAPPASINATPTASASTDAQSTPAPSGSSAGDASPSASEAAYDGELGDIVFMRKAAGSDQSSLFTIDADGSHEQLVHESWDGIGLSPDGQTFISPTGAPDGRVLPLLISADASSEDLLQIEDRTLELGVGDWSPDGARLVFDAWDDTDESRNGLYTLSRDGDDLVRMTEAGSPRHDTPAYSGAYSPDGDRILFFRPVDQVNEDAASMNLFVVNADGTGLIQLNPAGTETVLFGPSGASDWSPDGEQVTFVGSDGDFWETDRHAVFTVAADGSNPKRITPWGNVISAQWSPDGTTLAFTMASPAEYQIFTVRPDGTDLEQIPSSDDGTLSFGPMWSPDGSRLLFIRGTELRSAMDLWIVNADGRNPAQITDSRTGYGGYAWVPG